MRYKYLEFVRGLAAIVVIINHITGFLLTEYNHSLFLKALGSWGTEAVIVFFILSGIVINHTHTVNYQSPINFLKKRAIRILPIYYVSVLFAVAIDLITHNEVNLNELAGTLFLVATLQGTLTLPISTIIVVWSLSYEVFFYVVFALTIRKKQKHILITWFVLSLLCCILYYLDKNNKLYAYIVNMFAFSSLWLLGYYIYQFKNYFKTDLPTATFAFSMIPLTTRLQITSEYYDIGTYICSAFLLAPMFLLALHRNISSHFKAFHIRIKHYIPFYIVLLSMSVIFSKSLLISKSIYALLPILSLSLVIPFIRQAVKLVIRKVEAFFIFTGKISFALYLVHLPIIHLLIRMRPENPLTNIILVVGFSYLLSVFLELFFQKPLLKAFTKNK